MAKTAWLLRHCAYPRRPPSLSLPGRLLVVAGVHTVIACGFFIIVGVEVVITLRLLVVAGVHAVIVILNRVVALFKGATFGSCLVDWEVRVVPHFPEFNVLITLYGFGILGLEFSVDEDSGFLQDPAV